MTLLYYDAKCLDHHPSTSHPESPNRAAASWEELVGRGIAARCRRGEFLAATRDELIRLHDPSMLDFAADVCRQGGGYLEADTPVAERSFEVATLAAGACIAAVDSVLSGRDSNAFCLVRPPGHHATPSHSMGFCLFNNVATAAHHALARHQLDRILIVDWDVHHGNGTQDAFYEDPRVFFLSMHRFPFYPGTGGDEETGTGRGLGYTRNIPLAANTPPRTTLDRFASALDDISSKFRPQLVLVSAGFDAHYRDPIGGLNLDRGDFPPLLTMARDLAHSHCGGRIVSVLEGGYNVQALAECVGDQVEGLLADDMGKSPADLDSRPNRSATA